MANVVERDRGSWLNAPAPDVEDVFSAYLDPGERVLWTGHPPSGLANRVGDLSTLFRHCF